MPTRYCLALAALGLFFMPAAAARGADDSAPPAAPSAAQVATDRAAFDKMYNEIKEILRQRSAAQERYPQASDEQKKKLEETFNALNARATELRPQFKALTERVYLDDPTDKEMAKMLMATIDTTLQADEYEEVLRLSKLAIDRNIPFAEIYNMAGAAAFQLSDYDDAETYLRKAAAYADQALRQAIAAKKVDESNMKQAPEYRNKMVAEEILKQIPAYRVKWAREVALRKAEDQADDLPIVKLVIADADGKVKGTIKVLLFENEAPNTVANFVSLVNKHFYDGLTFHRVIPGFMAQGGDPAGNGTGGPGYHIADECFQANHRDHFRGSLSMAHTAERDTGGSQFFITFAPTAHLDGQHTVFGRVISGMDVLAALQRIDPDRPGGLRADKILKATVVRTRQHPYVPKTLP